MRAYLLMLFGLCAFAVFGIVFLRPSEALRLEGELGSLTPEEALERIDAAAGVMTFHDNLYLVQADLALQSGDPTRARTALLRAAVQEQTAVVQDQLAEVARVEADLDAAVGHLQSAYLLDPTDERRQRLGYWYRLQGNEAAELTLLGKAQVATLTLWEADRLARLLVSGKRFDDLEQLFLAQSAEPGPMANHFRPRLIDYLLESNRREDAVAQALRWFDAAPDAQPLETVIPVLTRRGALAEAYALAVTALDGTHEDTHRLLPLFAKAGYRGVTLDLQDRWLSSGRDLDDKGWKTLVRLAEMTGDLRGLRQALERGDELEPEVLGEVMLQFLRLQGPRALLPWHDRLTPELLEEVPLIGAAMMAEQGWTAGLHGYLAAAARQEMSDWDQSIWLALVERLRGTPLHTDLTRMPGPNPRLEAALGTAFVSAAIELPGP